jgi:Tfp pilus assembly protein PilF
MSLDVAGRSGDDPRRPWRSRPIARGAVATAAALLLLNSAWLALAVEPGAAHLVNLLLHPLLGLAVAVPLAVAWWRRRGERLLFAGGALLAGSALAGLALAAVGHRAATRPLFWAHLGLVVAGLLVVAVALAARRRGAPAGVAAALAGLAVLFVAGAARPRPLPQPPAPVAAAADAAGETMGGAAGPFHPSAAHTTTGAPLAAAELPPAAVCAGSGCHDDAVAEWRSSPHALSGSGDPWFLAARGAAVAGAGEVAGRWCAGCHEPARLATGAAGADAVFGTAVPAAPGPGSGTDGVTCAVCHQMVGSRNAAGQGGWVLAPAPLADFAAATAGWRRAVHALSIRLDPEPHRRSFAPAALAAAESCAACHKGRWDVPVNDHRPFVEINDYDTWQASAISGQGGRSFRFPERPWTCAECHLPPRPGGGRSHRFAAANRALAEVSGDEEQVRAVEAALADAGLTVDLFALVDGDGTVRRLADGAALTPGESVRLDVVVASHGVGHAFPGGKTDAVESWVELVATDAAGRVVFASGVPSAGPGGEPAGDAPFFRLRVVDGEAEVLEHRDLWRARATVYDRSLQPLTSDVVRYRLEPPADLAGPLSLAARLHYRPLSAAFHRWASGQPGGERLPEEVPAVVLAEARATLPVAVAEPAAAGSANAIALAASAQLPGRPAAAADREVAADRIADRDAWFDYGVGLTLQNDLRGTRGAFTRVTEIDPGFVDGWVNLGRSALAEGDLETAEAALTRAQELEPDLARTLYHLGRLARLLGDEAAAEAHLRRAAEQHPRDRLIRLALAQLLQGRGEHAAVVDELEAVLAVDPEWSVAHFNLMLAHKELGDEEASAHHQRLFERFHADASAQAIAGRYLESHPDDNRERQPIHEHPTAPAAAGEAR